MHCPAVHLQSKCHERGEGDLILGPGRSATGTLVERITRFTMLLHLPRMGGYGTGDVPSAGPGLDQHWLVTVQKAVRDPVAGTIMGRPACLRRSLTWDQRGEMARHAQLQIKTGLEIYFAILKAPGTADATKIPMACCANTLRKAQILAGMPLTSCARWGML
jgi:hypothetical protein